MKNMYLEEINKVFSGYIDIIPYSLEVDHKYNMNMDIFKDVNILLITDPNLFPTMKHLVNEDCEIIHLEGAFLKNRIESLKNFPKNTKALVCFYFYNVSQQAVTTIYEMGITNLDITIYNPESPKIHNEEYDIAIVGESSAIVPDNIKTVVSLGRRKISVNTLMNLAIATNTLDGRLISRIHEYSKEIAIPGSAIDNIYVNSPYSNINLQDIMNSLEDSILILDDNFNILGYNRSLMQMFNIKEDMVHKKIDEIMNFKQIIKYISNKEEVRNLLIEINQNKKIMLTIKKIKNILRKYSYIVLIKDVTKVVQLGIALKHQLRNRGFTTKYDFSDIYGNSNEIKKCIKKAKTISKLDKNVLIIGESGTGKELFAQSIHRNSPRGIYPFVGINCAALPSTLLESELFGYEEGAFTGAKKGGKKGLFELANKGTLFLDEIGDMPLETQAKVLRAIEEKEIMKIGSGEVISVDVRIIAATNKDLRKLIQEGKFREDLYYRLNVFTLYIPPLRKRKGDIAYLIELFIKELTDYKITINPDVYKLLLNHTWKGNVRELKNCVEYMVSMSDGYITMEHLPEYILEEYDMQKNENTDDIFYMLNGYEREIVINMIRLIDCYNLGRRRLHSELKKQFPEISEYKIRNLINNVLIKNNIVELGSGRKGMKLTDKGQKILKEIL